MRDEAIGPQRLRDRSLSLRACRGARKRRTLDELEDSPRALRRRVRVALDHAQRFAAAAKELDEKRAGWLNPPELVREEPDSTLPPRVVPVDEAAAKELKERTLTKLYNERPAWLDLLHQELDRQVLAAYRLPENITDDKLLAELLKLKQVRAKE